MRVCAHAGKDRLRPADRVRALSPLAATASRRTVMEGRGCRCESDSYVLGQDLHRISARSISASLLRNHPSLHLVGGVEPIRPALLWLDSWDAMPRHISL